MILEYKGKKPMIAESAFIADTAVIAGDVEIGENASVWFNAVIRAEGDKIRIGARTNIQDNCTLHCDPGRPMTIGDGVTVGHNAILHGCTVEDDVLIGMNATVLDRAHIRKGSIVGANAMVREGADFPENSLIVGMPAQAKGETKEGAMDAIRGSAEAYLKLSNGYKESRK